MFEEVIGVAPAGACPHRPYGDGMDEGRHAELGALVALLQVRPRGATWSEVAAEVLEAGSALQVWERWAPPALLPEPKLEEALRAAGRDVDAWLADGMTILGINDPRYPERLRAVHQAPPILFTRGSLVANDQAVSVVGSRAASADGLKTATGVARELALRGFTVAAGLARGIDTAAHRAALEVGGRTVAFIATGLRQNYPAENRELQAEVAARGLLVSQFWPDARPAKHQFLMRNAVMSGYGMATIVVEAGEHSGARAQARMAVEHGRPVILTDLVVQRNDWTKALVGRPGVHVAVSLDDVLTTVDGLRQDAGDFEDFDDFMADLVHAE